MVFHGLRFLKFICMMMLAQILFIAALFVKNGSKTDPILLVVGAVYMGIWCASLFPRANIAFSSIRIYENGILRKTPIGEKLIRWDEIAAIKIWTHRESAHHGSPAETHISITGKNAKELLLIQNSYDKALYPYMHAEATKRGLMK